MSETTTEIPPDIGRNEPCPCGSGEKYKKCCMNTHRVQKEAAKSSREPHQLIGEHTSPWAMYKLLVSVAENNMPKFLWQAAHALGPWRAKYPTQESYFQALGNGDDNLVARDGSDLQRIRHDGPDVYLLITRGTQAEVVTLRPNEFGADGARREAPHWGWRVWNVERHAIAKGDDVTFGALGYAWQAN